MVVKIPRRKADSRVEKAIAMVPRDGQWHRIMDMGFTSAEQTARAYNTPMGAHSVPQAGLEYGYTHETGQDSRVISVLWVRSV